MEQLTLRWHGHACFSLTCRDFTVVLDPYADHYVRGLSPLHLAADLVLCRGGASTLSELTAIGKPAIIVPSPYVTNHHQERNANVLAKEGGAVVLLEPVCSGDTLYETTQTLLADSQRRESMAQAMARMGIPEAAEKIYETLLSLLKDD